MPEESKEMESERNRRALVVNHTKNILGAENSQVHIFKTSAEYDNLFPVDVAVFEPTEAFNGYVVSTVGLSDYRFSDNVARAELVMVLPSSYKMSFEKPEYGWVVRFMAQMAQACISDNSGVVIGQVFTFSKDGKPCFAGTDCISGVISFPEMFPLEFFEEKIGLTYTHFLQVVPLNQNRLEKLRSVGFETFLGFDLHDADGPVMFAPDPQKAKGNSPIDKIISHNEDILNDK